MSGRDKVIAELESYWTFGVLEEDSRNCFCVYC